MQAIKKIFCSPQDATNLRLVWSRWKTFECKKHVLVIIKYQGQDPWTGALSQGSGGFHTLHDNEFLGSETSNLKVISLCLVLVCSRPDIFTFLFHMQLAKSLQHRNTWRTLKITERDYRRRRGEARFFSSSSHEYTRTLKVYTFNKSPTSYVKHFASNRDRYWRRTKTLVGLSLMLWSAVRWIHQNLKNVDWICSLRGPKKRFDQRKRNFFFSRDVLELWKLTQN